MTTPKDPFAVLRTKRYLALLVLAAVLGVVISFLVYWYLKLVTDMQTWVFTDQGRGPVGRAARHLGGVAGEPGAGPRTGPEAPVIALGGRLAVLAVKLARRDVPASTVAPCPLRSGDPR